MWLARSKGTPHTPRELARSSWTKSNERTLLVVFLLSGPSPSTNNHSSPPHAGHPPGTGWHGPRSFQERRRQRTQKPTLHVVTATATVLPGLRADRARHGVTLKLGAGHEGFCDSSVHAACREGLSQGGSSDTQTLTLTLTGGQAGGRWTSRLGTGMESKAPSTPSPPWESLLGLPTQLLPESEGEPLTAARRRGQRGR